ncbi:hypothetical protein D0Z08_26015 [Nocardioides immobilis]|uniref:Uncharacterized protein n=1 Tax=Nocardioides immobilis TaxID=2049295 RepID=A0A417XUL9_9ACTN|nr:hypothetical protein [Nocardioides immobilis]RHW24178.1 hypothetical protein D0Z08_26015 [Nocardioides immobilis]
MMITNLCRSLAGQGVGLLALFLVLTSGTAYALAESNTVFGDDIVDGEVTTADVADDDTRRALNGTDIRNGSLTALDFGADSVTGSRINESSLTTVPLAAQGGTGRYGFDGACNPETTTWLRCSTVVVTLDKPGRILIIGQVTAMVESANEWGSGGCRLHDGTEPIEASWTSVRWDEEDVEEGRNHFTMTAVTNVLPAGTRAVAIDCQDHTGATTYPLARMSAVTLSGS